MILIEAGRKDARSFDAKLVFARQLSARGHRVVLDDRAIPDEFSRAEKYAASPFLARIEEVSLSGAILIGAGADIDDALLGFRDLRLPETAPVFAIGAFANRQALVGAQSRIAYALGREPVMVDQSALQPRPLLGNAVGPAVADRGPGQRTEGRPRLFVYVTPELLEEPVVLPVLTAMDMSASYDLSVVVAAAGKELIRQSRAAAVRVYQYAELMPDTLAQHADMIAFFGEGVPGERMASLALNMFRSGKVVIDCTTTSAFATAGAPALAGPQDIAALHNYIEGTVLTNRVEIGRRVADDPWVQAGAIERLEAAMGLPPPSAPRRTPRKSPSTVYMPTNGTGLGHAQRCLLIAAESRRKADTRFAAFPSCVGLVRARGFDVYPLVQKSPDHPEEYANDIANYLRLSRILGPGDQLVFDGGYVFDSVYRTVHECGSRGVWIRRGLWQAPQVNAASLERERIFDRVIVPQEAFEELNTPYSMNAHVRTVGPVVQWQKSGPLEARQYRQVIAERLGRKFETLVVSMLGGGMAAERAAQLQTLCATLDDRPDCLHLVVVWPGMRLRPALFGWRNTVPVRTGDALSLARAADVLVAAAGYNSFHEAMYNRIPAIFMPQEAPFMDDQARRARAASDRGLAATVMAHEALLLQRELAAFLDGKAAEVRNALEAHAFPDPGNRAAARMIDELAEDDG